MNSQLIEVISAAQAPCRQLVLSETMYDWAKRFSNDGFNVAYDRKLQLLGEVAFEAIEVRTPGLAINVIHQEDNSPHKEDSTRLATILADRMDYLFDFTGVDAKEIGYLTVIFDPTGRPSKNAEALCQYDEQAIWLYEDIKVLANGGNVDHELSHLVTQAITKGPGISRQALMSEGIATWMAMQIKSLDEIVATPVEDFWSQRRVWLDSKVIPPDSLQFDMPIHPIPAMCIGAILFSVLVDELGVDSLMQQWKLINQYDSISDWISAIVENPNKTREKWVERYSELP